VSAINCAWTSGVPKISFCQREPSSLSEKLRQRVKMLTERVLWYSTATMSCLSFAASQSSSTKPVPYWQ